MSNFEHQTGHVMGFGLPDWPADMDNFYERLAYQRGVADERHRASLMEQKSDDTQDFIELGVGDVVQRNDQMFYNDSWVNVGPSWIGRKLEPRDGEWRRPIIEQSPISKGEFVQVPKEVFRTWEDMTTLPLTSDASFRQVVIKFIARVLHK